MAGRTVTIHEDGPPPSIIVPRGRSAAEQRLAAISAVHQPVERHYPANILDPAQSVWVCGECKVPGRHGDTQPARWPCTTARLLGPWPGETP